MVESHDGGFSWENSSILNPQIKRPSGEYALLLSPGKGFTASDGTITVPLYNSQDGEENVSLMYSKDNGKTWKRTNDVSGSATSESKMVELEDGTLRLFSRTPNDVGKVCYSDVVKGADGSYSMGNLARTDVPSRLGCNVTAITYSKKIDGKQAVMVSCPSNPNGRSDGVVYTFLVNEDKSITLKSTFAMPRDYGSRYAYACIDELPDGSIGILQVLYDHESEKNTTGFMAVPNSSYTVEGAELAFISEEGSTSTFKIQGILIVQLPGIFVFIRHIIGLMQTEQRQGRVLILT